MQIIPTMADWVMPNLPSLGFWSQYYKAFSEYFEAQYVRYSFRK